MTDLYVKGVNYLPIHEPIVDKNGYITGSWRQILPQLANFISEHVSQLGHFTPNITTSERNQIQSPKNGTVVEDTDLDSTLIYKASSGTWKTFTVT